MFSGFEGQGKCERWKIGGFTLQGLGGVLYRGLRMKHSLVIPACNEAARIGPTLRAYLDSAPGKDAEIIVVVNGSRDDTERILRDQFLPRYSELRLVVIPQRVGKGGALIRGLRESRGDTIAFTDADGSTAPADLWALSDALEGDGMVIGSRWLADSHILLAQPWSRRAGSRLFNLTVRLLFGMGFSDTQCGAKVMSRRVLETLLPRIGSTDWAFDVDLLFQARRAGFSIRELPITWRDVGGSKLNLCKAALESLAALSRLRLLHSPLRPLVRIWDNTLGATLYRRRLARLRAIYDGTTP